MSNFGFLQAEWPDVFEAAQSAENTARSDPRTACIHARRGLEMAVRWVYTADRSLRVPYESTLSALIHEPTFKLAASERVFSKARVVKDLGNEAVHSAHQMRPEDGVAAVRELFHVCYWLARTYARGDRPADTVAFDPTQLPNVVVAPKTREQLVTLATMVRDRNEELEAIRKDRPALSEELQKLREAIAAVKAAADARRDAHDYDETATRDLFIDLLLREAGWPLRDERDREYRVTGMPNDKGEGFVDYVLWGDDGLPLALVEAKRTRRNAEEGQQQAKLYADCLEQQFGRRPVIFYTNGYTHWLWDSAHYPPREVQGFLKKTELELMLQRRDTRLPLAGATINGDIVERYYQTRAIRNIAEAFEKDNVRKSLLVVATGSGKTRTVIALCDLLMRRGWVKRVLFLADRIALVNQAVGEFKKHLPDASPVNLIKEKDAEGRVYVSTYGTIMGLIDETNDGERRFGVGHFDLVIIDEAHRSVYQKYGAIFEYFDSMLVGLTATPKEEVDHNTYRLFDLEDGVPTDAYSLPDAIKDGFLVPPEAISVPLKFPRQGIRYEDLSEEEKDQWDELEWREDGEVPDEVDAAALNSWLFNEDTVDKVLAHLMTNGQMVAGGDRLGKTIIFAKNHDHAVFIEKRFNANYPQYKGEFARLVDYSVEYAQSLIDDFSRPEKAPHIAISVDMLDTGIDIPEIVNLVFFKLVRSKTKFWQMVGRGTRLSPDLFGPGDHKRFFYIFDYVGNLEFFSADVPETKRANTPSLSKRLFTRRLELLKALDEAADRNRVGDERTPFGDPKTNEELRTALRDLMQGDVAGMNLDNFVVRPHRQAVERFAKKESWADLSASDIEALANEVAGLPTSQTDNDEDAKRFDLVMLKLQLAVLRADPDFDKLRKTVMYLAQRLEEYSNIPLVQAQLELIQEVQGEEYWQNVTPPLLERLRRRLRALVKLIEKAKRQPFYTDFKDDIGNSSTIVLHGLGDGAATFEQFRKKALSFLREHEDNPSLRRVKMNQKVTKSDLDELERVLLEVGDEKDLERAKDEGPGLGLFIRSLVGLDREAAKQAFGAFLADSSLTANQVEFVNQLVDHLTEHGAVQPKQLYDSPYTDIHPHGPEGLFTPVQLGAILGVLNDMRGQAQA